MKVAFAKMLEKNPVESSHIAFRAGGNGVPILTRASGQSTTGYQTMGLPDAKDNKTSLGAFRMGDQDGNAPASAIYPGEIFNPPGQPDRIYPERTFAIVGNNVYQPENNDLATHALLKRLGEQKFKATSAQPFEEYMAQQRLVRDLDEASRNASLSDLGTSREIIRNLAAQRRQQNEDDYLRKMLDAGATPEAARKEIEDVRNANAIQEAKKVDDREYQAKTLIQRIAMSRGVTPMTREPLNQSSSIDNPQRSQSMSQAMGQPGEGFGTSPLDANRQFMSPEFYKKFLRKTTTSQESVDEQQAFNQRLAEGEIPVPSSGSFSLATLKGQERQLQIENASEALASRLESIRSRANRILTPLPPIVLGEEILNELYKSKGDKKAGNRVLFSSEPIQDLRPLQLIVALNLLTVALPSGARRLHQLLQDVDLGTDTKPSDNLNQELKKVLIQLNGGEMNVEIPFVSYARQPTNKKIYDILYDKKTRMSPETIKQTEAAHRQYNQYMAIWEELVKTGEPAGTKIEASKAPEFSKAPGVSSAIAGLRQVEAATKSRNKVRKDLSTYMESEMVTKPKNRATAQKIVDELIGDAVGRKNALSGFVDELIGKAGQRVGNENKASTKIQALVRGSQARKKAAASNAAAAAPVLSPTPGKSRPAPEWKAWAEQNNVPLPHTKKSLLERY